MLRHSCCATIVCMDKNILEQRLTIHDESLQEIADYFDCSRSTVRWWIKKHRLDHLVSNRRQGYDVDAFKQAVAESLSISAVLRKMNRAIVGSAYSWVKREVARHGLDTSHWKGLSHGTSGIRQRTPWAEVLVADSDHPIGGGRKRRLIAEGILNNNCYECGNSPSWFGKPLVLILDHIDGNRRNGLVSNLRLLCPNCNSQTETFCGRNKALVAKRHRTTALNG